MHGNVLDVMHRTALRGQRAAELITGSSKRGMMTYTGFDLSGRVAVVVGGTSGIGQTIGRGLAEAGADVISTGRRAEMVEAEAKEIEALGRRSLRICSDVMERASLQKLLDAAVSEFGKVDILVYAAGRTKRTPFLDVAEMEWNQIVDTNLTGAYRVSQVFGRHMVERKYGRVIHIASLSSFVGLHEVAAYGASKSGLAGLTRTLAVEWARFGVCVNAIAPGVFLTAMNDKLLEGPRGKEFLVRTPMGRFGRLEELVGSAIFLASEAASFVTGTILPVDGGFLASGVNQ
jgi:NAD(P)-dependent dehydrogenase (short-subunit alcohol dehydrogenase family)